MIVSNVAYDWFMSGLTGLVAAYWIGIDSYRLRKALRMAPRDAGVRDRIFGSSLGIVIGIVGVAGVVMHHVK